MIHDIYPKKIHNEYAAKVPDDESNILYFIDKEVMINGNL